MKQKGVSTYRLREECGIDSKTVRRLKANDNIETKTLNKLCSVLGCKIEDIMEYVDEKKKESGINLQPQEATQAIENYMSVHRLPLLPPEEQAEMKKLQFYDPAKW